ncbi:hypothetical protein [Jidongwangia harbinensis]|uniref:hypothetical protein n=1 Tax=Jidongwangia harbinensis TaxID=2878561 RepID=UPI001CDA0882|nr:hypothetical protein [Jidongwangia harbinensis]MCA2215128.1 hypothetical protein [Jidongwangia harbinensis]
MSENDLEYGLAAIAEHGHRTGRLDPAGAVRSRANRRRRRRFTAVGALGVAATVALGAGIATARPPADRTTSAQPTASRSAGVPSSAPAPPPPAVSSAAVALPSVSTAQSRPKVKPTSARPRRSEDRAGPLSGDRQLFIYLLYKGEEVPESVLAVTKEQRVEVTADYGDRALFVPDRDGSEGDEFLIRTGKIRSGGESDCWSVEADDGGPGEVVTAACDFGDQRQRITIEEAGKDNQDRMTYSMRNGDRYLTYDPQGQDGFAAQNIGDDNPDTTFVFIDRGESTIPTLG